LGAGVLPGNRLTRIFSHGRLPRIL
jgi:hypothetical protein